MFIMWYPQEGHDAMKLELFEHNQKAYEAAISMMAETGKAAIIHPTGTGKSLIAFKLAMEHPQASVYWLAPSSYIYHTQLENLQQLMKPDSSDKQIQSPDNITFISYSKLMHGLKLAGVDINRKMLSEMAISDAEGFAKLVEVAKAQLS